MSTTNILDLNNRLDALEKSGGGGSADSAKRSDIATEFNTTTAYTAGCFVYHEGKLYQFNADHAAGAWDSTDVVEANVTDQIVSNKAAIDGLTASDVVYDNTDSELTATDVQGALNEVVSYIDHLRMTKLWDNPSSSSSFAAQNITLSSDNYDMLLILYNWSKDTASSFVNIVQKNHDFELTATLSSTNGVRNESRYGHFNSATEIHFNDGKEAVGTTSVSTDNDRIIPFVIYGIKLT